ncbi:MAG: NADH-quinone oxidoreductase subunit C [Euryarchaeota archaeon]|nr:NADH-quinone oxidoreductase subunit C [Euryarchaeota archaeon]MDE1835207.1 NADH-quinone oxidoreductase subunit C [Euryarchaeota archaeon]MDE1880064.1 NADH-quinone oxidoreductase subunit C [Euryarchaeota archaeon]MDE2043503.1 NADH-quinone oxidoreductase subunit C [Thermoplasmata archaeon]
MAGTSKEGSAAASKPLPAPKVAIGPAKPGSQAPAPAASRALAPRTDKARVVEVALPSEAERDKMGKDLLDRMKEHFLGESLEVTERAGVLARVKFPSRSVVTLCTWLRDQGTFGHCAMVAAVDWRETREVLYTLWSDHLKSYLELTTTLPADDPHIESVSQVWPGASWHEREAWDLVGVLFDHHPDLRRLFLPEGYKFHPLLKTFELHEPEDLEVKARTGR